MSADELLLQCKLFRVVRRQRRLADGTSRAREVVLHPGAVAIVPMVDDHTVCLIRNYRTAVEKTLVEVPAGTLEPGEEPSVAAGRELEEETGYIAGKLTPLTTFLMSPGILNERMHVFVATELRPGPTRREAGEEIDNLLVDWQAALEMVLRGEIEDAKTVASLLHFDRFLRS